jgi:hypothetical protein
MAGEPARPGWQNVFTAWERFDALWFLRIADGGYRLGDGSAAFFPLYPLVTRGLSFVMGGHPLAAATLVSNAAFCGGLIVTYLLTTSELSERAARNTILLMCLFPTAHFFLMPYSESLFFLLSVTAFWGARRGRWMVAGAAGALAALTRSVGFVLAPALLVEAIQQRNEGRGRAWPGVLAAGATVCGLLAYLAYWGTRAGEWLAPVTRQANWQREFSWPWVTLWNGTGDAFRHLGEGYGGYWLIDWLIVVPMLAASVYAVVRLRPSYAVYLWCGLLIPLTFVFPDRPLMSMPRFVLPLFPPSGAWSSGSSGCTCHGPPCSRSRRPGWGSCPCSRSTGTTSSDAPFVSRPGLHIGCARTVPCPEGDQRDDSGSDRRRPFARAAGPAPLPGHGRRDRGRGRGLQRPGAGGPGERRGARHRPGGHPDARDGRPRGARKIRESHPKTGVIMLTAYDDRQFVVEAVRSGARGYVLKARDAEHLIQTVRLVAGGNMVIDPQLVVALAEELSQPRSATAGPRP